MRGRSGRVRAGPAGRAVAAVAIAALALRLPALFARSHLGFDDGVYGASARVMRDGAWPFRNVFSSQGPLFLPLVWLADLLGLRRLNSPRLLAVTAGVGVVVATLAVARLAGAGWRHAVVAAGLAAASGSLLWVTGPLTSDGVAVALATTTIAAALAYGRRPSARAAVLIGLAGAATLSVKSLLAGVVVPVVWIVVTRGGMRKTRDLTIIAGVAVAAGLAIALPFGFARVWDQSVRYHLDAAGHRTPLANIAKIATTFVDRDLPLVVGAALAAAASIARRRGWGSDHGETTTDVTPIALWLAATAAVLVLEHPLWRNHLAHAVPPLALLIALRPPPARVLVLALAIVVPWHVVHNRGVLWPQPYRGATHQAVADVRSLPSGTWSISDEPGLVWRAGKRPPADLVDTSRLRIEEHRITTATLTRAARDARVCTVLVWSHRFGDLPNLPAALARAGFVEARRYDRLRILYVKQSCQLP